MSEPETLTVTVPEAAKRIGFPRTATYELVASGELGCVRIPLGKSRAIRIPVAELERFIEAHFTGGSARGSANHDRRRYS